MKLLEESDDDLVDFNDKTPFTIMFGPDKCGAGKVFITFTCCTYTVKHDYFLLLQQQ